VTDRHEPENWYWDADSDHCPHGPEPDGMSDKWDEWMDRHQAYGGGMLCLDAPAGEACAECSVERGEMVPWAQCDARIRRQPHPAT
jgi:hypothetical protein